MRRSKQFKTVLTRTVNGKPEAWHITSDARGKISQLSAYTNYDWHITKCTAKEPYPYTVMEILAAATLNVTGGMPWQFVSCTEH